MPLLPPLLLWAALGLQAAAQGSKPGGEPTPSAPAARDSSGNLLAEQAKVDQAVGTLLQEALVDGTRDGVLSSYKKLPAEARPVVLRALQSVTSGRDKSEFLAEMGQVFATLQDDTAGGGPDVARQILSVLDQVSENSRGPGGRGGLNPLFPEKGYEIILVRYPRDIRARSGYGRLLMDEGRPAEAFDNLNAAVEAGDRSPGTYYWRGAAAEKLGDPEQAHADAAEALRLDPGDRAAEALYRLTKDRVSKVRLLDEGRASPILAAAASMQPAGASVTRPAGSAPPLHHPPRGGDAIKESDELTRRAAAAFKVGDPPTAMRALEKAVELNPVNAHAYNLLAAARLKSGDAAGALKDAARALSLKPKSGPALNTRSRAYAFLGDFVSALRDAEDALALEPKDAYGLFNRAHALAGLGRRTESLESLREAAGLQPAFQDEYAAALRLPQNSDLALLFQENLSGGPLPGPARGRARFPLGLVIALAGSGLVILGLVRRRGGLSRGLGGTRFAARYAFLRELGAGGMGVVVEAKDLHLGRRVAVKRLKDEVRDDSRERERFLREARVVAALRHPRIVEIYSVEEEGPDAYLVFEYLEGRTLHDVIHRDGPLGLGRAVEVFRGVSAALEYAHGRGVVHRDLKPANIMVQPDGGVKVMDFGVARMAQDASDRLTARTSTVAGTLPYMAPEQEQGKACAASDVYSLGVCLYEAVTGRLPFSGTAGAALLKKLDAEYDPPSRHAPVPPALDALIARALEPDPGRRLSGPAAFLEALEGVPDR